MSCGRGRPRRACAFPTEGRLGLRPSPSRSQKGAVGGWGGCSPVPVPPTAPRCYRAVVPGARRPGLHLWRCPGEAPAVRHPSALRPPEDGWHGGGACPSPRGVWEARLRSKRCCLEAECLLGSPGELWVLTLPRAVPSRARALDDGGSLRNHVPLLLPSVKILQLLTPGERRNQRCPVTLSRRRYLVASSGGLKGFINKLNLSNYFFSFK